MQGLSHRGGRGLGLGPLGEGQGARDRVTMRTPRGPRAPRLQRHKGTKAVAALHVGGKLDEVTTRPLLAPTHQPVDSHLSGLDRKRPHRPGPALTAQVVKP